MTGFWRRLGPSMSHQTRTGVRLPMPADALGEHGHEFRDFEPHLLGRIAIAQRDRVVVHSLMIDGDAERGADLVLAPIAAADRTSLIVGDREVALKHVAHLYRLFRMPALAQQRVDRD